MDRICIVSPCFNEQEVIEMFYSALKDVLDAVPDIDYRLILVDDGSSDSTLEKLNALAAVDPSVRVYSLSRNFGHQAALSAGLDAARGDAVIMMDSDLQHPPTLIPRMIELWREGNDIVSAVRQSTADATLLKRFSSRGFYWVLNLLSDTRIVPGAADFCLLSRKAHGALRKMPEKHRFLRGMVSWMGYRRALLPYEAAKRAAGKSKYSRAKMVRLALDATFSFSVTPIRIATRLGLSIVALGMFYLTYILVRALFFGGLVQGWSSMVGVTLVLGGLQFVFIGLIGAYLGRVFEEVKRRPTYLL